jgi:hypothetical protein
MLNIYEGRQEGRKEGVDARAIYIPATTETPQDILQRLGFVWNTAKLRYVVNPTTGVMIPFPKGIVGGFCGVGRCLNGTSSDAFA